MKRYLSIICLVSIFFTCAKENVNLQTPVKTKIDSITDFNSLKQFVKTADSSLVDFNCMSPHDYKKVELASSPLKQKLDSTIPKTDYIKVDLDGNGLMDLVITGETRFSFHAMALINKGDDDYKILQLNSPRNFTQFPVYTKLVMKDDVPIIEVYEKSSVFGTKDAIKSSLVYKNGGFVDYQDKVSDYQITKIEFGTTGCFGTCPVFDLTLVPNGKSRFDAKYYNFNQQLKERDEEEGKFETVLKQGIFEEIVQMMNEMNINELDSNYRVGWTDDQTSKLSIHFADGSIKYIQDYGMQGTRGLMVLYEKLLALRFNQDWQRI